MIKELEYLNTENQEELTKELKEHLNFYNPEIGARGPLSAARVINPIVSYYSALDELSNSQKSKVGRALGRILLEETLGSKMNSNLVFNILDIAQTVPMPEIRTSLEALKYLQKPLEDDLKDKNENLYYIALLAMGVNQGDNPQIELWESLLKSGNEDYIHAAELGIRSLDWKTAVKYLPIIAEVEPKIDMEVMTLIDTHPEGDWPDGARGLLPKNDLGEKLYGLIQKYSIGRFKADN
jgi:hypothetical protein